MKPRYAVFFLLMLTVALQLGACGSTPPTRFYTLSSLAASEGRVLSPGHQPRQVIGIGPVALAKYLDHPGITTRSGPNTMTRSELDRWGGSLSDEVTRVLVEDMGQLLPVDKYLALPWLETAAIDYRVQLNITRFDGPTEGPVVLNAAWMFFGSERNVLLASGDAAIVEPLKGTGYAAIADAMSRALAELSRRIAVGIQTADRPGS